MSLHISSVAVENFKRLKEVDIDSLGNVVIVGGRNAQGKSSLIDAIWNTLGGKQRAVTRPIRDGETKASAEIVVEDPEGGGFVVTRVWKQGKPSTLTVKPIDGKAAIGQAQSFLDKFIGSFAFDPLEFAEQDPKKQRQTLIDLIGVDVTELDRAYDVAYEGRLEQGREVRRIEGALASLERPGRDVPEDYVSVIALSDELEAVNRVETRINEMKARVSIIDQEIADYMAEREELITKVDQGNGWLSGRRSVDTIRDELQNAETLNASVRDAERWRETKAELKQAEMRHAELEKRVEAAKQAKIDVLAKANLPLEGLSFDEEGILYNDVPFTQASAAERRRVSVAIAMAMNPDLRVICLKDASLLDDESKAEIIAQAEANDFQLFLEVVGKPGGETIVIEDGEVA